MSNCIARVRYEAKLWARHRLVPKALVYLVLALYFGLPFRVFAADTDGVTSRIEREGDCFRFSTYGEWLQFIKTRTDANPGFSLDEFKKRFPQHLYEESRRTIACSFFTYVVDGVEIGGFSAKPKQGTGGTLPVIIYNHGGTGESSAVTFGQMLEEIFPLALQGFFVVGSQYRQQDEFGGKDVEDVLALFDILDRRADVSKDRIGMIGWSRGGIMTMLVASRSSRLRAIALGGTPTDLLKGLESRPDMEKVFKERIPNYAAERQEALEKRSPLVLLDSVSPNLPILILHGSADVRAPAWHALALASKLQKLGRSYGMVIYPNGDHGLTNFRPEVRQELGRWFQTYLVDAPSPEVPTAEQKRP